MPLAVVRQFLADHLHEGVRGLVVACSGGLDSMALLQALFIVLPDGKPPIRVAHIHHGLNPAADDWAEEVARQCGRLGLSCLIRRVHIPSGGSLEESAREARYRSLAEITGPGEVLVTAHHGDDQAETVLLQLLRGSAAAGMASMRQVSAVPYSDVEIPLWRPFLSLRRQALEAFARGEGLTWVRDSSNDDQRHRRNYLRHTVIPALERQWPQAVSTLAGTAMRMQETDCLLHELAALDMRVVNRDGTTLEIPDLLKLSTPRQHNLLRYWIMSRRFRAPGRKGLQTIINEICLARPDASPCYREADCEVRRYRDKLYVMSPRLERAGSWCASWMERDQPFILPDGRQLQARQTRGCGLPLASWRQANITVRLRHGGEWLKPAGSAHHKSLKALFQEAGIPPWERVEWPLIYVDDQLALVPGKWVAAEFAVPAAEDGIWIT
jgi:tRNA(Ile)-lysidine synthase